MRNIRNIPSIPYCGGNFHSLLILQSVIDKVVTPRQPSSQETISLILSFLHFADNFFFTYCIGTFLRCSRVSLSITRDVSEREEISSWKSFSSVSILILGKCCASKKKMATWWYARVWDSGYCCDFVKWRACGTRTWSRESRVLGEPPF